MLVPARGGIEAIQKNIFFTHLTDFLRALTVCKVLSVNDREAFLVRLLGVYS